MTGPAVPAWEPTSRGAETTVAVMQPYFFPYAGYHRLLMASDMFLIFDCVQFIRRGRIHRSELPGPDGCNEWLTLPLAPARRDARIDEIRLAPDARRQFDARLRRFPVIERGCGPMAPAVRESLQAPLDDRPLVDYVAATLSTTARLLGLNPRIVRTSSLALAPGLRGQSRVLAAVRAVGGDHYVNAPGGRDLYSGDAFRQAGVRLSFLAPYEGRFMHLLPALLTVPADEIREDLAQTTRLLPA